MDDVNIDLLLGIGTIHRRIISLLSDPGGGTLNKVRASVRRHTPHNMHNREDIMYCMKCVPGFEELKERGDNDHRNMLVIFATWHITDDDHSISLTPNTANTL